jgi:hypothetical protein
VIDVLQDAGPFVVQLLKLCQKIAPSPKLALALDIIPTIQVRFGG